MKIEDRKYVHPEVLVSNAKVTDHITNDSTKSERNFE